MKSYLLFLETMFLCWMTSPTKCKILPNNFYMFLSIGDTLLLLNAFMILKIYDRDASGFEFKYYCKHFSKISNYCITFFTLFFGFAVERFVFFSVLSVFSFF